MSRKLLTLLRRGGGASWIEKNAVAGTWTLVEDDGSFTADKNDLAFPAQTTPTWGDLGAHFDAQTRAPGLGLYIPIILTTWEEMGAGWHTAAAVVDPDSMEHAIQANATDGQLDTEVPVAAVVTGLTSAEFKTLQVLRDNGCFYIVDGKLRWVSDTGATATLYPSFANLDGVGTWGETNTSVAQFSDYNSAWGGDWSEVTVEDATAVSGAYACEADAHSRITFTWVTGETYSENVRFIDNSNYGLFWQAAADGKLKIYERSGASTSTLLDAAMFSNGVNYTIDTVVSGATGAVYVNKVLKWSGALQYHLTVASSRILNGLTTNDGTIINHPYPALGIATSRVVCPQTTNTYTHAADFIAEIKNVTLPAGDNLSFQFRISGSDELTLNIASDGSLAFLDNATSRITAAGATVSDDDDIVLVCDGANGQIFVNGASVGTTTAIAHLTGTSGKRLDATTGVCDHIALFPRDVSGLLPKGTF